MLRAEVEKLEHWCQQMEREAEDYELPEESECGDSVRRRRGGWRWLGMRWDRRGPWV